MIHGIKINSSNPFNVLSKMLFEIAPPLGFANGLQLGQSLRHVVSYFKSHHDYSIKIQHCSQYPTEHEVKVVIAELGIELSFNPTLQVLNTIHVVDLNQSSYSYLGTTFCSPYSPTTFHTIYRLFGPTFPGKVENDEYHLQYRGINFIFDIPEQYLPLTDVELPLILPDGTSPNLKAFTLVPGDERKPITPETTIAIVIRVN